MTRFASRRARLRLGSLKPQRGAGIIVRPVLLGLIVASMLVLDVPAASASSCPTSIDSAIRVSEAGSAEEVAPSELDRPFPDVPERLAPGSDDSDRLRIRSIAEVPIDARVHVDGARSPIGDSDLYMTITWNGDTVADGTHQDVVGHSYDIAGLAPGDEGILGVEVDLPATDEWDNRTQNRTWPLQFSLGIGAECGGGSEENSDAAQTADSSTSGEAVENSDDRGNATGEDARHEADDRGDRRDSAAADDRGTAGPSAVDDSDSTPSGTEDEDDGTAEGGSDLPRTGFDSVGIILLAGAALGFGAVLLAASRRRRTGDDQ